VQFPASVSRLPARVRVADASKLDTTARGRSGFLHAKAILIEAKAGSVLITGSANPTAAAWIANSNARNAELIVLRRIRRAETDPLRLASLWDAPEVDEGVLEEIRARSARIREASSGGLPLVAVRQGSRLKVDINTRGFSVAELRDTEGAR